MPGIAAVKGTDKGELDKILASISHRGPDGKWTRRGNDIGLGCLELYVGGHGKQDSHFAIKDNIAAVIDGRIYNVEKGEAGDAEALIGLYTKYGPGFAAKIDGDFACAIMDGEKLIVARDWVGIKPLYFGHTQDGTLCFASEAKGVACVADDVKEFPPGYVYSREIGWRRFHSTAVETPEFENYEQAKKLVRQYLMEAVEKRMKDGAVKGITLSGGLDSSLITYMAYQIDPKIECYTVSMPEGQDLPLAKDVTKYLGIKHHILMFGTDEIHEILPQAIYHQEMYEESCVHGAIANFLAGGFVRKSINCVLSGEGADEFFAGYDGQFRQGKNPEEVAWIVEDSIRVAHNTALQRLDRLAAANGIESRAPFLDSKVVDFSMKIPMQHKIHGPEQVGKWVVRQAFEGCLPEHIIYQTKRFFAQGSGVASIMRAEAEKFISEEELQKHNSDPTSPWLSSVEELYYYRMFKQTFKQPACDRTVGRWDPVRPEFFRRFAGF